jgi:hypothetical protein
VDALERAIVIVDELLTLVPESDSPYHPTQDRTPTPTPDLVLPAEGGSE